MTARQRLGTLAWVPLGALLAGAALLLPPAQRLSRPLLDAQRLWLAPAAPPEGVLVVDIDDASLASLRDTFGPWPYRRGVYALLVEQLREAGAAAIAIDLLLADAHEGDAALARVLSRPGSPVVLGAAGLQPRIDSALPPTAPGARSTAPPAQAWPALALPARSVWPAPDTPPPLGVITTPLDDDGRLRTMPLWHEAQGHRWPAMPLALWQLASAGGEPSWPLTAQGRVDLALPGAAGAPPVWSLARLVQTESGPPGALAEAVRGRVVFIGSSALLADTVMTPGGQVTGTVALAEAYAALRDRGTLRPAPPWVPAALVALALVPGLLTLARGQARLRRDALAAGIATLAILAGGAALLAQARMPANWLPALAATWVGFGLTMVAHHRWLARRQHKLEYENAVAAAASRAKSEFLANVSHEIRTPMNALLGVAELLAESELTPAQRRHVQVFRQSGQALHELINDLLDISKIEAGRFELESAPFALLPMLEQLMALMRPRAEQKGLHLVLHFEAGLPGRVVGDRKRLEQVLLNLLGNALKFTPSGSVTLTAGAVPGGVRFEVSDTGIGIVPSKLEAIFEPFTQADASTARHYGGTGLGLAITKNVVELMGGRIEVRSSPGQGTVFRVVLPLPQAPGLPPGTALPAPAPAPAAPPSGLRVLLAEDNEVNVYVFEGMLQGTGTLIETAPNGPAALEKVLARRYDLIFMDVQMPGMDGLTVTRRLREFERARGSRRTPVVALTANAFASDVQASTAAGCDAHLNKPYDRRQLLDTLCRWGAAAPRGDEEAPHAPGAPSPTQPAIDVQAALARLGGNAQQYERARAHAAVFVVGWAQDFEAARRGGPPERTRALVRDLRVVADTIAARALAEAAARLEAAELATASGTAEPPDREGPYAEVLRALEPVIVALTRQGRSREGA